jgi:hypothetical protein
VLRWHAGSAAVWTAPRETEQGHVAGYNQVFEQVFQAYEQRLPKEALLEFAATSSIAAGK